MTNRFTRRDCAKALLAAAAPGVTLEGGRRELVLENSALRLSLVLEGEWLLAVQLTDRIGNAAIDLPPGHFELEFEGGRTIGAPGLRIERAAQSRDGIELLYVSGPPAIEVRVRYTLPKRAAYVRKQISLRQRGPGEALRLMRADLDNWRGVRRDWSSMRADALPYGSHPIFCDRLWAGVEFVAAFNSYDRDGFVLRSRPGGRRVGAEWVDLHSTVAGAAEPGHVRDAFLRYLDDIRLAPPRWVACYNSWWTLPTVVKQEQNLRLIATLKEKLFDRHGVFFDIVTTDMGWSNPRSIWEIDRTQLPQGFDDIRAIVESARGRLGLWMSPSETYPPVCDYEWLEQHGYVVLRRERSGKREPFALSLADPKYRNAVTKQLPGLIQGNNLGHIKYDGFVAQEPEGHHDLLPGADSVEPLARHALELLEVSRKADPTLFTEPTCINSLANYISPWILKYSDSAWGNAGGDCPPGINPAPDYRESHTNAREWYIFSSLREFWLPQNAVQYFDIVHCDRAAGFANHAAMAVGRGRFFLSTYINPAFMSADDWRIYAGLLKWARASQEILRHTVVLPSRVEAGEPYVYAHWRGARGILAVRNPSNASQDFALELRAACAPKSLSRAVCYTQYPCRRGIARDLRADSTIHLKLAPWELLFLEIVPQEHLAEPVAFGARWYSADGETYAVPDRAAGDIEWMEPHGAVRRVRVTPRPALELHGRIVSQSARRLPESEWLADESGRVASTAFDLECEVNIAKDADGGRLLLLVEYPGRRCRPSRCKATLDGRAVDLAASSSALSDDPNAGHIGYYHVNGEPWKDLRPYESHWHWYECAVPAGISRVRFDGAAGFEQPRIGVWLWSENNLGKLKQPVGYASSAPAMPEYRPELERNGICLLPPRAVST